MSRIAAIDFGTVRIGVALSDPRRVIAQPLTCLKAEKNLPSTAQTIAAELGKHAPLTTVVLGLPLHLSGRESPLSTQVRLLAPELEKLLSIPVILWDERLTTALVERALKEGAMNRKNRKAVIDALTATVILQGYLDSIRG